MTIWKRQWALFGVVVIIIIGAFLRFWNLSDKVFMHDESLFAYYSYCVYPLFNYRYEPILHGPLLLHLNALLFATIGDSDFTARSWCAFFGVASIGLVWRLRHGIGITGALCAAAIFSVSPTLLYYSRFLRNDILLLFFTLLFVLAYLNWYRGNRSSINAFFVTLCAGMMVCIKENAVFVFFTSATFLLWAFIVDLALNFKINTLRELRPSFHSVLTFIYIAIANCLFWICIFIIGRRLFIDPETQTSFTGISRQSVSTGILVMLAVSQVFAYLVVEDRRIGLGRDRLGGIFATRILQIWKPMLSGVLIALSLYAALFTTWFKFKWGFFEIYRETLAYWWGQHQEHRLKGPFHYYMFRILIYETLPLMLICIGILVSFIRRWRFFGIYLLGLLVSMLSVYLGLRAWPFDPIWADQHLHMTSPWHLYLAALLAWTAISSSSHALFHRERLGAFLIWWTLFGLLEYSYAGEKVPWIGVHIVGPLILWAGYETYKLTQLISSIKILCARLALAFAVASLGLLLFVRQIEMAVEVCFERPTDPGEMLVYNHTMSDMLEVVREIEEIAQTSGEGKALSLSITGEAAWPLYWYLRHYDSYLRPEPLATTDDAVVLMNEDEWRKHAQHFQNYKMRKVGLRQAWVPEPLNIMAMWNALFAPEDPLAEAGRQDWRHFYRYFMYREPWMKPKRERLSEPYSIIYLVRKDYRSQRGKEPR